MNLSIFKAYDIRGLCPGELEPQDGLAIGRAVARFLGGGPVVIAHDMRDTSDALRDAVCRGLLAEGVEVVEIGRGPTPMLYFAVTSLGAMGGVMVTASHNPGRYNGLKICGREARPIGRDTGLQQIRELAVELEGQPLPETHAQRRERSQRSAYFDALLAAFPGRPKLRVAIDCGNGIVGEVLDEVLERLPLEVTRLYFEPDGNFPHHEANPLIAENMADLQRAVLENGLDLGIAFDGDGDRAMFVDENAELVPADLTTALFASFILEQNLLGARAGSTIVYDLRSSHAVADAVREHGGQSERSRVGHAYIKALMRELESPFGGELSGHFYFRFPSGYIGDDGIAAMLLLLQLVGARGLKLSELWKPHRRFAQSGEINSSVDDVESSLAAVRAAYADGDSDELDGLTVRYPDWWFNLRPSNTEPLLRLNVEAQNESELAQRRQALLALIR